MCRWVAPTPPVPSWLRLCCVGIAAACVFLPLCAPETHGRTARTASGRARAAPPLSPPPQQRSPAHSCGNQLSHGWSVSCFRGSFMAAGEMLKRRMRHDPRALLWKGWDSEGRSRVGIGGLSTTLVHAYVPRVVPEENCVYSISHSAPRNHRVTMETDPDVKAGVSAQRGISCSRNVLI